MEVCLIVSFMKLINWSRFSDYSIDFQFSSITEVYSYLLTFVCQGHCISTWPYGSSSLLPTLELFCYLVNFFGWVVLIILNSFWAIDLNLLPNWPLFKPKLTFAVMYYWDGYENIGLPFLISISLLRLLWKNVGC